MIYFISQKNRVIKAVADPGGRGGHAPPDPVKISHKKMATKGGRIDFMFLAPPLPGCWIRYWDSPFYIQTQYRLDRSYSVKAVV